MSDITTAAPAGASEQTAAPTPGPMSVSAAAERFAGWDAPPDASAEAAPDIAPQNDIDATPLAADTPDTGESQDEETAAPADADAPAPEAETDAEPEEDQYVHGNAKTRLRDGKVVTVAELKKLADEATELRARVPDLTAAEQQLRARQAQLAQQEQFVSQTLPLVMQQLQAKIPPMPDAALVDETSPKYDPIRYVQEEARHKLAIAELQQAQTTLQRQQQEQQQQAEQARAAEHQKLVADGRKVLLEKIPDLADPVKGQVIYDTLVATCAKYGISKDLVDATPNPNLFHMIHELSGKAAAYDKMNAQKQVAQKKAEAAPPVQQPGRRVSGAETQARVDSEQLQRAKQRGGRIEDMAALFAKL